MKVFVTGATGFLGAEITRALLSRGHDCAALTRADIRATRLAPLASRVSAIRGDLLAPRSYREALQNFRPDALIHCGWGGVWGSERNDPRQIDNASAAARLAQIALDAGARVLVGVGSQAEYGPKNEAIREDDPAAPTTLYGVAKLAAAGAFSTLAEIHGARAVWGRAFSLYGPEGDGPWLVPSLLRAFRDRKPPELTHYEQTWEFTHVRDAARAYVALLETPTASGLFNVACGAPVRLRDAVLMLRDLVAPGLEPLFGRIPYRPDQVMRLNVRIDRIRDATGWRPEITLEDGFAETAAAFLDRQDAA